MTARIGGDGLSEEVSQRELQTCRRIPCSEGFSGFAGGRAD
jgi:hypothetical protein